MSSKRRKAEKKRDARNAAILKGNTLEPTPAGRLEQLYDMYAPMAHDEDGEPIGRDPEAGVISLEDFKRLLDVP